MSELNILSLSDEALTKLKERIDVELERRRNILADVDAFVGMMFKEAVRGDLRSSDFLKLHAHLASGGPLPKEWMVGEEEGSNADTR